MVILRLTNPVGHEFETEVTQEAGAHRPGSQYVRPCERYKELYKSCKSIRGRLHQYYVYGELLDCEPHKQNYEDCLQYRNSKDINVLDRIIAWEQNLIITRMNAEKQNTTWEFRTEPPTDFASPLPDHLAKRKRL